MLHAIPRAHTNGSTTSDTDYIQSPDIHWTVSKNKLCFQHDFLNFCHRRINKAKTGTLGIPEGLHHPGNLQHSACMIMHTACLSESSLLRLSSVHLQHGGHQRIHSRLSVKSGVLDHSCMFRKRRRYAARFFHPIHLRRPRTL